MDTSSRPPSAISVIFLSALHGGLDGGTAQVMGGEAGKITLERAHGRAGGADDNDGVLHGKLLLKKRAPSGADKPLVAVIGKHVVHIASGNAVFVGLPKAGVQQVGVVLHEHAAHRRVA